MSASRAALIARHAAFAFLSVLLASAAHTQDFADAAPEGPARTPAALLERGLPALRAGLAAQSVLIRWWGLRELETRSLAVGGSLGTLRLALGGSATGDPQVGWNALAIGIGTVAADGGAALRACGRRDRAAGALGAREWSQGSGYEAGAGAWLALLPTLRLWASAPQLWREGAAPPLARPLELGARATWGEISAHVRIRAPARDEDGERLLGVTLARGSFEAWLEARDAPLRGSFGVSAVARGLGVALRIDDHPVLGETTTLALTWSAVRAVRTEAP